MHNCAHGSADTDGAFFIGQKGKFFVSYILLRRVRLVRSRTLGSHPRNHGFESRTRYFMKKRKASGGVRRRLGGQAVKGA